MALKQVKTTQRLDQDDWYDLKYSEANLKARIALRRIKNDINQEAVDRVAAGELLSVKQTKELEAADVQS